MRFRAIGSMNIGVRTALAGVCLGLILGCGGAEKTSKKGKKGAKSPDAQVVIAAPAPAQPLPPAIDEQANIAPNVAPNIAANPPPDAALDDDPDLTIDPDDGVVYAVRGNVLSGERFEILKPSSADDPDQFAIRPIQPGLDSSMFAVVLSNTPRAADAPGKAPAVTRAADESEFHIPEGFTPLPEAGLGPEGLPWRLRCDKDGSVMVLVPAGAFVRGTEQGAPDAAPEHEPFLSTFYMDAAEITSEQYESYRADLRKTKKRALEPARSAADAQEPVLGVNWGEANSYAHWAGKELPTEAQWEKAARGEHGFRHPWGNGVYLWQRPRTQGQIDRVRSFPGDLSPYGVFDMAGNAREWCADWYSKSAYRDSGSGVRNPAGPKFAAVQQQRVVKGGDPDWLVWSRAGVMLTERLNDIGFRSVLNSASEAKDNPKEKARKPKTPRQGAPSP